MGDVPNLITPVAPPAPQGDNLHMLYYGLLVVGIAAAVLAIYNLIIIRWCTGRELAYSSQRSSYSADRSATGGLSGSYLVSSFKYKKKEQAVGCIQDHELEAQQQQRNVDYECPVCLSLFEDGEEVRELPRCKHSFHAKCIDMWLFSHLDCPLCRRRVEIMICENGMSPECQISV